MTQLGRSGNCEGVELASAASALSRRAFMRRAGGLVLGASLAQIPETLDARGLVGVAEAQTVTFVEDTFNGLLAFSTPGDDPYSRHQGVSAPRGGGVASGATRVLIASLDRYVHASVLGPYGGSVPASSGVAALLNDYALQASPLAPGPFPSQVARPRMGGEGGGVPAQRLRAAGEPARARSLPEPVRAAADGREGGCLPALGGGPGLGREHDARGLRRPPRLRDVPELVRAAVLRPARWAAVAPPGGLAQQPLRRPRRRPAGVQGLLPGTPQGAGLDGARRDRHRGGRRRAGGRQGARRTRARRARPRG